MREKGNSFHGRLTAKTALLLEINFADRAFKPRNLFRIDQFCLFSRKFWILGVYMHFQIMYGEPRVCKVA